MSAERSRRLLIGDQFAARIERLTMEPPIAMEEDSALREIVKALRRVQKPREMDAQQRQELRLQAEMLLQLRSHYVPKLVALDRRAVIAELRDFTREVSPELRCQLALQLEQLEKLKLKRGRRRGDGDLLAGILALSVKRSGKPASAAIDELAAIIGVPGVKARIDKQLYPRKPRRRKA